jgi:hypothetical protein
LGASAYLIQTNRVSARINRIECGIRALHCPLYVAYRPLPSPIQIDLRGRRRDFASLAGPRFGPRQVFYSVANVVVTI